MQQVVSGKLEGVEEGLLAGGKLRWRREEVGSQERIRRGLQSAAEQQQGLHAQDAAAALDMPQEGRRDVGLLREVGLGQSQRFAALADTLAKGDVVHGMLIHESFTPFLLNINTILPACQMQTHYNSN